MLESCQHKFNALIDQLPAHSITNVSVDEWSGDVDEQAVPADRLGRDDMLVKPNGVDDFIERIDRVSRVLR